MRLDPCLIYVSLLAMVATVGCTSVPKDRANTMLPAAALAGPQHYVLVTLANPADPAPGHTASTPRDYDMVNLYAAGSAALRAGHAIAASYQLREVSSWPIMALGLDCIVYELPQDLDLQVLLVTLSRDARVTSAQALLAFEIEPSP